MTSEIMHQQCLLSQDRRFTLHQSNADFPFTCELSLVPLVEFWQRTRPNDHPVSGAFAARLQEALRRAPALLEPLEDFSLIAPHRELVDMLMAPVFPQAFWDEAFSAALIPFHLRSFYATPAFERLLMTSDGYLEGRVNVDQQTVAHVRLLHVYAFILCKVYGIEIDFEYPLIFTATDHDSGLDRHFRMNFDGRFIQVKTIGGVKPLTEDDKQQLLANLADPQVLMAILPPEQFVLHGFGVLNAVEVTDQEVLSSLKRDLIEKESIVSNARFTGLQAKLRTLFRKPDLLFSLAACHSGQVMVLHAGAAFEHG